MDLTIGVDVGGTKIAAGVVDEDGEVVETVRHDTPPSEDGSPVEAIIDAITDLQDRHEVVAVGIGAAGYISSDRSTAYFGPNVNWGEQAVGSIISEKVGLPVVVENDANAAAWGEFRFGAGKHVESLLLVTVGTGVGGGVVNEGRLFRGAFGFAAEIGHLRVVKNGIHCGCGQYGCLEQYGSGRALVREARDRVGSKIPGSEALADASDDDVDKITGPMITELARGGDPMSIEIIADVGRWLGEGIASLGAVLDPGLVAIGGGVSEAGDLLLGSIRKAYMTHLTARSHRPHADIELATLGGGAGLIGAADLARLR